MVDILGRSYNKEYVTKYVSVIPGNLYGPHDNFNLTDAHVIPALIHKCYLVKMKNSFNVCGSGKPLRQFTYAEDFAKYLVWVLFNYEDDEPLIISNETENSIFNVVTTIAKEMNYEGEIYWDKSKSDGQYKKTVSSAKLRTLIPNLAFRGLEEVLRETIQWFKDNYPDVRM